MKDTWVNSKIPSKSQPFLFRLSFGFLISLLKPLLLRLIKFNIHGIFLIYASVLAVLWSRKAQGEKKKKNSSCDFLTLLMLLLTLILPVSISLSLSFFLSCFSSLIYVYFSGQYGLKYHKYT